MWERRAGDQEAERGWEARRGTILLPEIVKANNRTFCGLESKMTGFFKVGVGGQLSISISIPKDQVPFLTEILKLRDFT